MSAVEIRAQRVVRSSLLHMSLYMGESTARESERVVENTIVTIEVAELRTPQRPIFYRQPHSEKAFATA